MATHTYSKHTHDTLLIDSASDTWNFTSSSKLYGDDGPGLHVRGAGNHIEVGGYITSGITDAVLIEATGTLVHVLHGGDINGLGAITSADHGFRLINDGTVYGAYDALFGSAEKDVVVNRGTMSGAVTLGGGNDVFDTRAGSVDGTVAGNLGDDTLFTSSPKLKLIEHASEGHDTVKSTVSYTLSKNVEELILLDNKDLDGNGGRDDNQLIGNVGDNVLKGMRGDDALDGGKGDDYLVGGAGTDTFGFATGYGKDEISDFHRAEGDTMYVHNWKSIGDFGQVRSHALDHDNNVWITVGNDILIIDHMHKADLIATDVQF